MSANPSPAVAALLSFLFPGLGQIYAGDTRKGVIWALPMIAFIVGVLWLLFAGKDAMFQLALNKVQLGLLILNVAFFCYHVAAMLDAYAVAQHERMRNLGYGRGAPIFLASIIALTIVIHGVPEVVGYQVNRGLADIFGHGTGSLPGQQSFSPEPSQSLIPIGSFENGGDSSPSPSTEPGGSSEPTPTGTVTPASSQTPLPSITIGPDWPSWAQDGRLNLLLVGGDSRSDTGLDTNSLRTDSMILLSVDIQSGKAAMFSFSRNMCSRTLNLPFCSSATRYPDWFQIPLSPEDSQAQPGGVYNNYLNALWRDAAASKGCDPANNVPCSPGEFVGSPDETPAQCQQDFACERGWRALAGSIQAMTGQNIDGIVAVNLKGFVSVVANLPDGGIWLNIPSPLYDDNYFNSQQQKMLVNFQPGCQFLNPEQALAYARSRHQDSDYQRERRQQFVLQSVRKQLDPLALLPHIPALLQVAQENLFTTLTDNDLPYLAQVAARVDAGRMYQITLAPGPLNQLTSMADIQNLVTNIFQQPEPQPQPTPSNPGQACPPRT
jgi:LCP family protein required for cell wall assembly